MVQLNSNNVPAVEFNKRVLSNQCRHIVYVYPYECGDMIVRHFICIWNIFVWWRRRQGQRRQKRQHQRWPHWRPVYFYCGELRQTKQKNWSKRKRRDAGCRLFGKLSMCSIFFSHFNLNSRLLFCVLVLAKLICVRLCENQTFNLSLRTNCRGLWCSFDERL